MLSEVGSLASSPYDRQDRLWNEDMADILVNKHQKGVYRTDKDRNRESLTRCLAYGDRPT